VRRLDSRRFGCYPRRRFSMSSNGRPAKRRSLATQLVWGIGALLLVTCAANLVLFTQITKMAAVNWVHREVPVLARAVGAASGSDLRSRNDANLQGIVRSLRFDRSIDYAEFLDPSGHVLAQSDPKARPAELGPMVPARNLIGARLPGAEPRYVFTAWVTDSPATAQILDALNVKTLRDLARMTPQQLAAAGYSGNVEDFKKNAIVGYLRVVGNTAGWGDVRAMILGGGLPLSAAILALGILVVLLATRYLFAPLRKVSASAIALAHGDLTQRVAAGAHNEVGVLADSFNQTAEGIATIARRIRAGQVGVRRSAGVIRQGASGIADRAVDQNRIVDEVSASVEQSDADARAIAERMEDLSASAEETGSSILEMAASLEEVARHVDGLHAAIEDATAAAVEMAQSIAQVDESAEELRAFATETATTVAEMDASIRQVRENAERTAEYSESAARDAEGGGRAVAETASGMEEIRSAVFTAAETIERLDERSREIGKILSVIEEVADQTNLLALNAAILAAQAGEEGRGFGVVASEIRALSERTSAGAQEIAELLSGVQGEVMSVTEAMKAATRLVRDGSTRSIAAAERLTKILEGSRRASGAVQEIARATAEQAEGSRNVATAAERVRELVTQIAAATSQQRSGARHIERAVEATRDMSQSVRGAIREQKNGGDSIARAAEHTLARIREILSATERQRSESTRVVDLMGRLRQQSVENLESTSSMEDATRTMSDEVGALEQDIERFKTE
jgi:methyl-accepting chemotaxis protein